MNKYYCCVLSNALWVKADLEQTTGSKASCHHLLIRNVSDFWRLVIKWVVQPDPLLRTHAGAFFALHYFTSHATNHSPSGRQFAGLDPPSWPSEQKPVLCLFAGGELHFQALSLPFSLPQSEEGWAQAVLLGLGMGVVVGLRAGLWSGERTCGSLCSTTASWRADHGLRAQQHQQATHMSLHLTSLKPAH